MPESDAERAARHAQILKRIEQRKQQETRAPIQSILAATLDALNAAGLLSAIKRRPPANMSAYGPKTFSGGFPPTVDKPLPDQWVGSILWHKPKGYAYYQTLRLLGIWALGTGREARIVVVEKRLTFIAPVFNPESYYTHIKRKFDIFYGNDARPPVEDPSVLLYDAIYDEAQRLKMRSALAAVLRTWVTAYQADSDEP